MTKIVSKNNIKIVNTDKFKTVQILLRFVDDVDYKDIPAYNLLIRILTTRNKKYKSVEKFSEFCEDNYDLTIDGDYTTLANLFYVTLASFAINDKYTLNKEMFNTQIETLKDCLYHPYLTNKSLNLAKEEYLTILKNLKNNKNWILQDKIKEYFGNDNPYGCNVYSNYIDVSNVTLKDIKRVYNKLINSPCYIYVCGDVDNDLIFSKLSEFNTNPSKVSISLDHLKEIKKDKLVYEGNFNQSVVTLIYSLDVSYKDKLNYASNIFKNMLSNQMMKIIREKDNLCYVISPYRSFYNNLLYITTEIDSKNLNKVVNGIDKIIKEIISNPNLEQFEIAKKKAIDSFKAIKDNQLLLLEALFVLDLQNVETSLEKKKENYSKVTIDEVVEVAKKLDLKIISILKEKKNED